MSLPPSVFHPAPCADAAALAAAHRSLVLGRLREAVDHLDAVLPLDLGAVAARLERVDPLRPTSPWLTAWWFGLQDALDAHDLDRLVDALAQILHVPDAALYDAELAVGSILTEGWERPVIDAYRAISFGDAAASGRHGGRVVVRPRVAGDLGGELARIEAARAAIRAVDPVHADEIGVHITRIKLFHGAASPGGSTERAQGAVFMVPPDPDRCDPVVHYVDWLVHEGAHLHLNAVMAFDGLVEDGEAAVHTSPIRPDKRPLRQVLHAVFVLYRLVGVFDRLLASAHPAVVRLDRGELLSRRSRHHHHLGAGIAAIADASFTPRGTAWSRAIARASNSPVEACHVA